MSNNSTPSRLGRGIRVPGIGTQSAVDQKYHQPQQERGFSPWPLTPPSAQDSRRPSLAFSSFSDASHSGPSSVSSFSQPATPMHSMVNSAENFHRPWHDATEMHVALPDPMETACTLGPSHTVYNVPLQTHGLPFSTSDMSTQVPTGSPAHNDAWQHALSVSFNASLQAGLGDTIYQSTQSHGHQHTTSASMCVDPSASMRAPLQQSVFPDYDSSVHVGIAFQQQPQVVVPSQLGPQGDYPMELYHGYEQDEKLAQSFSSNAMSAWDPIEPPSPMENYSSGTDDGYDMIKNELPASPSRTQSPHRRQSLQGPVHGRVPTSGVQKPRKAKHGDVTSHASIAGIEIKYDGSWTVLPDETGRMHVYTSNTKPHKPHKCTFEKADGTVCAFSTDRMEHLKRHAGSHTNIREYPCPLPKCKRKIGRSDNILQHLRTHIKLPKSGSRNEHFDLIKTCKYIRAHPSYADNPKGAKLIANLQKNQGGAVAEPQRGSRRRTTADSSN